MSAILRRTAVTTAGNTNLVSGSAFEYPQQPSQVSLGIVTTAANMFCTLYAGGRLIAEEFEIMISTSTYPVIPDNVQFNFVILPGERLVVAIRNASGGTLTTGLLVDMQPIG